MTGSRVLTDEVGEKCSRSVRVERPSKSDAREGKSVEQEKSPGELTPREFADDSHFGMHESFSSFLARGTSRLHNEVAKIVFRVL